MSTTLNDLLAWSERLPDRTSEEAQILRLLIERREAELRMQIADLIVSVSQRENWKLHRCAATARRIERTPTAHLEAVLEHFRDRSESRLPVEAPNAHAASADGPIRGGGPTQAHVGAPLSDLYSRMGSLEARLAETPGVTGGIQGVRIMRMVALMSNARSAHFAHLRISGIQAVYRHM